MTGNDGRVPSWVVWQQRPFPDATSLAYLGVSAIVAGVVATVNLLWNALEDAWGKGLLRDPNRR